MVRTYTYVVPCVQPIYKPHPIPECLTKTHPRSGSFYPQPISNYLRRSTLGLAIDFPTLNVLGFCCYTISTASFLYSPTIKSQYAYRHPEAPETTVRFNDFLFAAHGAVMCVVCYSQFFPSIWGCEVGKSQRVSRVVLTIWWGCVVGVLMVLLLVWSRGGDGAEGWAWIDVVSRAVWRVTGCGADNGRFIPWDTSSSLLFS
jgi:cystinosin